MYFIKIEIKSIIPNVSITLLDKDEVIESLMCMNFPTE